MNGLSPWIKIEVECWEPVGLAQMMKLAQHLENKELMRREAGLKKNIEGETRRGGPTKRLSDAEFQARKEKGLCFCCERYHTGHCCKVKEQREFRVLVVRENEEEVEIFEEDDHEEETKMKMLEVEKGVKPVVELSINSVVGLSKPGTMKMKGKIDEEAVIVLIDCGEMHNFISEKLVTSLNLPMMETANYGVTLGSELGGVDVILRMQWFYSLGLNRDGLEESDHDFPTALVEEIRTFSESISVLLAKFEDVFDWPKELHRKSSIEHHIHLKKCTYSSNVRSYRYAYQQKEEMEKLVDEMYASGVIRSSTSPYSGPVLLVKKKDGYHQIRMSRKDVEKTTFKTHEGHYEFLVMPFGLINAPSTFQLLMNTIFKPHLRRFVLVFFDDILSYNRNLEEHLQHLKLVFEILREHELYANMKKCNFAQARLEYLGHIISGKGVEVDLEKIGVIKEWPPPTNVRDLEAYDWIKAREAFEMLKNAMTTLPILALPDFNLPFKIKIDASGYGIGAVLIQAKRPIAYFSHTLSMRDWAKPVYERELMAIVLAIQKWR
ncbi:peroxidase 64 [Cucumis melo var. makuwa]|uniref:Disease resistance protein n=1 Tax=Cucumis melo var. makuwa TaxID=1194695 RepID=A0A5A7UG48_CUCMM|nr:disease resistance protein [Cucumis melo var. makuwa]TYK15030.1 peroxidase 64 [Cucumis melo var. makuwa]